MATKYEILDQISKYILTNNLLLKNGHVVLDKKLKTLTKSRYTSSNEEAFFEILESNISP